jgi:hypothetical protein
MAAATRIAFFTTVRQVPALAAISSMVRAQAPALSPHRRRSAAQDHSQRGAKVYALHAGLSRAAQVLHGRPSCGGRDELRTIRNPGAMETMVPGREANLRSAC